jgi:hypothetical protein
VNNKAATLLSLFILAGLIAGCRSTTPTTKAAIAGRYTVRGDSWYAYEDIALRGDRFEWHYETDALPGPEPISGSFLLDGCLLIFEQPQMRQPHRIITHRRGTCMMWTPEQYEQYLRTGKTPADVLYQTR